MAGIPMTMKARTLYSLQQTDLEIAKVQQEMLALDSELSDQSSVLRAQRTVDQYREQLKTLRTTQKDKELEASQLGEKIQEEERQMYSGRVKNPRELESMQTDNLHLKVRLNVLEDSLLQLMDQGDAMAKGLEQSEGQLQQAKAHSAKRGGIIHKRLEEATGELQGLGSQRKLLATEVLAQDLLLYERLQKTRGGQAVAQVEGGRCLGCNMAIPTHQFQRARSGRDLVECGNCGRILFVG